MSVHTERRKRLMDRLNDGLIFVPGLANPGFRYLTGFDEPRGTLLLAPQGARLMLGRKGPGRDYHRGVDVSQLLFLPRPDPVELQWGDRAPTTTESVRPQTVGVDRLIEADELEAVLSQLLPRAGSLHVIRGRAPSLAGGDDACTRLVDRIRRRFFGLRLEDGTLALDDMRRIKDPQEIAAIERAVGVTAEGFDALLSVLRPGGMEYVYEAELTRVYRGRGADHAFGPIVACGANALRLHYRENDGPVESGRLLLVDSGAAVDGYHADVTRTFPVDGTFTPRQRELYEVVLRAQSAAVERCRPGATISDVHVSAYESIDAAGYGEYFVHGTGHHLGLETHDVGDVHLPLVSGAVITVEPGVYLPDEGLGIRIEDDVLITEGRPRVLSASIPRSVEDIEARLEDRAR